MKDLVHRTIKAKKKRQRSSWKCDETAQVFTFFPSHTFKSKLR